LAEHPIRPLGVELAITAWPPGPAALPCPFGAADRRAPTPAANGGCHDRPRPRGRTDSWGW